MSQKEIINEIFHILEVDMMKRGMVKSQIINLQERLKNLISDLEDGKDKEKVLAKIKDKQRFCYYINDTGILDFTGYGGNFW